MNLASFARLGVPGLLGFWGSMAAFILLGGPRPFDNASVEPIDLAAMLALGLIASRWARDLVGVAAVIAGFSGAVALQLFVRTGQGAWETSVGPHHVTVSADAWLLGVAVALAALLIALVAGVAIGRAARTARDRRIPGGLTSGGRAVGRGSLVGAVALATVSVAVVGVLAVDASSSLYVRPPHTAVVTIVFDGSHIVSSKSITVAAGWVQLDLQSEPLGQGFELPALGAIFFNPLSEAEIAQLANHRVRGYEASPAGLSGIDALLEPGVYAVFTMDPSWQRDVGTFDGWYPTLDEATISVLAGKAPVAARGDAGPIQVLGFAWALVVAGLAAFLALVGLGRIGRPGVADGPQAAWVGISLVIAVISCALLGGLAIGVISLIRSPL